jgi:hypothetical protein
MNRLFRVSMLLLVVFSFVFAGILGCGGADPQPQQGDFTAEEMQATEEAGTDPSERGEPSAPDGEPTEIDPT